MQVVRPEISQKTSQKTAPNGGCKTTKKQAFFDPVRAPVLAGPSGSITPQIGGSITPQNDTAEQEGAKDHGALGGEASGEHTDGMRRMGRDPGGLPVLRQ